MRDAVEILVQHPIKGKESCIAWGVEFIAKLHDQIHPTSDILQEAHLQGLGFGDEASNLLRGYKIAAWESELEWDDFDRISKDDAREGFPLVFTLPSLVNLNLINGTFGSMSFHACVAVRRPHLEYATRAFGIDGPFSIEPKKLYALVRGQIQAPNYCIHCLRHRPAQVASLTRWKTT